MFVHEEYDGKCDIWSVACIMAELMFKAEAGFSAVSETQKVLFKGDSCFPFSPVKCKKEDENVNSVSQNDQLLKILRILGKQDKKDYDFIKDEKIKVYFETLNGSVKSKDNTIDALFPHISSDIKALLKEMLVLDPTQRPSAAALLKSPLFDSIRKSSLETSVDFTAQLKIDKLDNEKDLTIEDYHTLLQEELAHYA